MFEFRVSFEISFHIRSYLKLKFLPNGISICSDIKYTSKRKGLIVRCGLQKYCFVKKYRKSQSLYEDMHSKLLHTVRYFMQHRHKWQFSRIWFLRKLGNRTILILYGQVQVQLSRISTCSVGCSIHAKQSHTYTWYYWTGYGGCSSVGDRFRIPDRVLAS